VDGSGVQSQIDQFWNAVAPHYDSPDNVAAAGTAEYANWLDSLRPLLPDPPARVLDVGTGTGFLARLAADLGHHVDAVDLSERMLEAAADGNSGHAIAFAVGDAVDPPFGAESFDAVISRSLLWTLRDLERAFRNWYRLLGAGGRIVAIYGLSPAATPGPPPDDHPDQEPDLFERHYTAETRAALTAMHLSDHQPLVRAAADAGFQDVEAVALDLVRGWETSPGSDLPYALVGRRPTRR
jgi:ubiquinone/menaquinone biosynthesis C-methylase UbiE